MGEDAERRKSGRGMLTYLAEAEGYQTVTIHNQTVTHLASGVSLLEGSILV